MLQVANHTPFAAALCVFPDAAGVECAYGVVKATFQLAPDGPVLAERQVPLLAADQYWGEPATSSLRAVGDFTLPRPATDVLLVGRAVVEAPTPVQDVRLRVGTLAKTLRVFGDRRWERNGKAWRITPPEPWQRMPLRWELAFGGCGATPPDAPPEYEARNPVGRGFTAKDEQDIAGRPLPNLEDPDQLIASPQDRPAPACCAPVAATWLPRRLYAGTYDAAWQRQRAPHLPPDFDARFFQMAPPGLVAPGHLAGGEAVELAGCTLGGPLRFDLPACSLELDFDFDGQHRSERPALEMVLLEPDAGRLQMLWRAGIRVDKRLLRLRELAVRCPGYARKAEEV